jgi:cytochrome c peroxidase
MIFHALSSRSVNSATAESVRTSTAISAVLDHYAAGGRTIATGPLAGVGHDNPNRSPTVRGFTLSREQRADLIAFLQSLTDESVLSDPRLSNPWR